MNIKSKIADALKSKRIGLPTNSVVEYAVSIEVSDLMQDFADKLVEEMSFHLPRGAVIPDESSIRLVTYFKLLFKMRCNYVNGKPLRFLRPSDEEIVVPAFIHLLLSAVGKVSFKSEFIELTPKFERMTDKDEENWDSLKDIRRLLVSMSNKFTVARGLPRDIQGLPDFMSMRLVEQNLWHHRDDVEPSTPLMAAFINTQTVESLWHDRVNYGPVIEYKRVIEALVEPRSKE